MDEARAQLVLNFLKLVALDTDAEQSMEKINPYITAVSLANSYIGNNLLFDLYLTGFSGRVAINPGMAIIFQQLMMDASPTREIKEFHQSMINRITWLSEIQFFTEFSSISAKAKSTLKKVNITLHTPTLLPPLKDYVMI